MPAPASRAQDIAARLKAAAYEPRMNRRNGRIRIEVSVPESPSEARWRALLAALERADRFGIGGGEDGLVAWAVIWREPPDQERGEQRPR
ncbi:hypothetical protein [Streptomyces sp. NPDC002067]